MADVASAVAAETGAMPAIDAGGGTTDGRFVHPVFPHAEIVELGLPENGGIGDGAGAGRGGMHQVDERCSLADLRALRRCYSTILTTFGDPIS